MSNITRKVRALIVALAMLYFAAPAAATGRTIPNNGSEPARTTATQHGLKTAPRAGSPEFGILIIIGIVGVLVIAAWVVSRVSDDSSPRTDGVL